MIHSLFTLDSPGKLSCLLCLVLSSIISDRSFRSQLSILHSQLTITMAKGDDIQERLMQFGVRVIQLCSELPRTEAGRHLAGQLLRCGTSVAPNYGEARGADSAKDFVHKLGIVLKELNESLIWLRMVQEAGISRVNSVDALRVECVELSKIIAVSIRTVRARKGV